MLKVTRTITYIYKDELAMRTDMDLWREKNGFILCGPTKTILSETSEPITLPPLTPTKKAEA